MITLIGVGGSRNTLTAQAQERLRDAGLVIGARRVLQALPDGCTASVLEMIAPSDIADAICASETEDIAVVYSGDTGFYSGAAALARILEDRGFELEILPGLSSVQMLAAALHQRRQDWHLVSAHGRALDPVLEVCRGADTVFLTSGSQGPSLICSQLSRAGLGQLEVVVGEYLGSSAECLHRMSCDEAAQTTFAPLNVLWVEAAHLFDPHVPGLPDDAFVRVDGVPMTKRMVRAAVLAQLQPSASATVWDIGAGTGGMSIELAHACRAGRVWAVEGDEEACRAIRDNRARFCAWNLELVEGWAPDALEGLPTPDIVFIGGSKGTIDEIVEAALAANPNVRIAVTAIALETLSAAVHALESRGMAARVMQVQVSETRGASGLHLLFGQNPTFIVVGERS